MPSGVAYVAAWGGVWRLVALLSAGTCAWAGVVAGCCWRLHPPSGDKCFSPSMDCSCSSPAPVVATMVWLPLPPPFPDLGWVCGWPSGWLRFIFPVCLVLGWDGLDGVVCSGTFGDWGGPLCGPGFVLVAPLATRCLGLGPWCGCLDNECPPWFGIGLP